MTMRSSSAITGYIGNKPGFARANQRVTILVKASDFGGVRGPTIACVVADEIAFWASQGTKPDGEVLSAIRPAMATIPDTKLLCISTGYAQTGALFDAHSLHYGKDDDDVLVWQADTASMNPIISQAYIDKEIEKDLRQVGQNGWVYSLKMSRRLFLLK